MPFANEHAARIKSDDLFVRIRQLEKLPNGIRILGGPLKTDPEGSAKPQSYRFPKDKFTPPEAKTWLKDHDIKFILFEDATEEAKPSGQFHIDYESILPKYIKNVSKDVAEINLFDEVGDDRIKGQDFADEIQMLNNFGVKEIHVNINSPGGNIMHGFSIFSAITGSEAEVHTHIVGVAASMAGIFALAGDHTTIIDFGKVMLHDPLIARDGEKIENLTKDEEEMIQAMRSSLLIILKNRTNKTEKELSDMMKAQTWLTAKEALEGGFVDEIVSSKHKDKDKKRQPVAEIANILNFNNTKNMKNVTKILGLNEDATEASIFEAIQAIQNELSKTRENLEVKESDLTEATNTIEAQKTKITEFESKHIELNKKLVEETVEAAIKEGKLAEKDKETLVEKFEDNVDGLKMIVNSFVSPAQTIINQLKTGGDENNLIPEGRKDWNLRQWEKKDPKGLASIKNTNIDLFKTMWKKQYSVEYTG